MPKWSKVYNFVGIRNARESHEDCYVRCDLALAIHIFSFNRPLPSSKNPHFQNEPSPQSFFWKWVLFAWEWKIISISKAEHLTSFWYRGPGELGTGIIYYQFGRPQLPSNKARCKQNCNNHGPVVLAVANYNIFKMAIILDLVLIKIIIHI